MADAASVEESRSNLAISGELTRAALYNNAMDVYKNVVANAITCKSTSRPSNPVLGQEVYESDTGKCMQWNGSAWVEIMKSGVTVAGGALTGTYPNPTLAANSVSSSNIVDGSINIADLGTNARVWGGGIWFLTWSVGTYQQQTLSVTVPTRSLVMFIISSTAYTTFAGGPFTMYSMIDGVTGWNQYSAYFHNTTYDHRTYPTGNHTVGLTPATYTFRLYMPSGQNTDTSDFSLVEVIGFPY
jgi:hypothetical protein